LNDPADYALRLCKGFLEATLRQPEIDPEALKENRWRIEGVKQLLQSLTTDDHPLVADLEAAQRTLMAKRDFDDRQAVRLALNALPVHWESAPNAARNQRPSQKTSDTWLRYRAWLSTRPRR
jgi:hypothetical protein